MMASDVMKKGETDIINALWESYGDTKPRLWRHIVPLREAHKRLKAWVIKHHPTLTFRPDAVAVWAENASQETKITALMETGV